MASPAHIGDEVFQPEASQPVVHKAKLDEKSVVSTEFPYRAPNGFGPEGSSRNTLEVSFSAMTMTWSRHSRRILLFKRSTYALPGTPIHGHDLFVSHLIGAITKGLTIRTSTISLQIFAESCPRGRLPACLTIYVTKLPKIVGLGS